MNLKGGLCFQSEVSLKLTDVLTMAWFRRRPAPGLLHLSDRGSQYASHAFQDKLREYGMTCSMSRPSSPPVLSSRVDEPLCGRWLCAYNWLTIKGVSHDF